jgi:hypothetical protein
MKAFSLFSSDSHSQFSLERVFSSRGGLYRPPSEKTPDAAVSPRLSPREWLCSSCGQRYPMPDSTLCVFCALVVPAPAGGKVA